MTRADVRIRPGTPADADALVALWERAVRATHDFVTEDDIAAFRPMVREAIASRAFEVLVAAAADGAPAGWIGMTASKVEALFIDPSHQGRGIGRRLMQMAEEGRGPELTVDVNEQNGRALEFYESLGFVVEGRSPVDATGRPYPLLHLRKAWARRTYSLWRGDVRLGTFVGERPTTHHGEVNGAHGRLIPEVPPETLNGIWQVDFGVPGMPMMQDETPPVDATVPPSASGRDRLRSEVALDRAHPAQMQVPRSKRLSVRDESGAVVEAKQILLDAHIIDAKGARRAGLPEDTTRMFHVAFFAG